jgi:radical SAM protein with 4Fe4S-binding SPASM domain
LTMVDYAFDRTASGEFKVNFFGGEPTLSFAEVERVVAHVRRRCSEKDIRPRFSIVTNGTAPPAVMNFLVENDFDVVLSMDSAPKIQHRQRVYLRGQSADDTVKSIKFLVSSGAKFRVRSTVTGEAVSYMGETTEYFAALGVRTIHFEPVGPPGPISIGKRAQFTEPKSDEYAENFVRALDRARSSKTALFSYAFQHLLSRQEAYCAAMTGSSNFHVLNATGDITMCPEMQDSDRNQQYGLNVGQIAGGVVSLDVARKLEIGQTIKGLEASSDCKNCFARDICRKRMSIPKHPSDRKSLWARSVLVRCCQACLRRCTRPNR